MSMYNHQGIPEYLVKMRGKDTKAGARPRSSITNVEWDIDTSSGFILSDDEDFEADDFEDDILILKKFHFISTTFSR